MPRIRARQPFAEGFMTSRRNILKFGISGAIAAYAGGLAGAQAQGTITARIGHLEAPTQPRHKGLEKVAALVKERTKGAVEFELYPVLAARQRAPDDREHAVRRHRGHRDAGRVPRRLQSGHLGARHPLPVPDRPRGVAEAARRSVRQGAARELSRRAAWPRSPSGRTGARASRRTSRSPISTRSRGRNSA